jgi:hypothetical protein
MMFPSGGLRSALVALSLVATAAPAELRDARLVVRGLARVPGTQTVTLRAVVSPAPTVRAAIEASLEIGSTRVTLEGKVGPNGRLQARVRRVDLAAAGTTFTGARVDLSGGVINVLLFGPSDCATVRHGTVFHCRSATGPGDVPDGVYDLMIGQTFPGTGVAQLTTASPGTRRLSLYASAFDSASLAVSPGFSLDGDVILGGDVLVKVTGSATPVQSGDGWRIDGTVIDSGGAVSWAFVMQRPDAGTPAGLGDAWHVELVGGVMPLIGGMPLVLDVAADGVATTQATTVEDTTGTTVYELSDGDCLIAPAGALSCRLPVVSPPDLFALQLHGVLDLATGSGQGEFFVGSPPFVPQGGTWSATRP